jgi:hypothetical protein
MDTVRIAFFFIGDVDSKEREAYEAAAESLRMQGFNFFASGDIDVAQQFSVDVESTPLIFVVKSDDIIVFTGDMEAEDELIQWFRENKHELVAELSASSYVDLKDRQKIGVLCLYDDEASTNQE